MSEQSIKEILTWFQKEGINIIPLHFRDKRPVASWKRFQEEKISEAEIAKFFLGPEKHNLGAICGAISDNLYILDFDDFGVFESFFPDVEKRKNLCLIRSGRGVHCYFKTIGAPMKILKTFDREGREIMTVKGEASYCVAPPSIHSSGKRYKFVNGMIEIPKLAGNVREDIKNRCLEIGLNFGAQESGSETIDIANILLGVARGNQDNSIMWISHYLRRQGTSLEEAFSIIQQWNKRNSPVIPEAEVWEKLKNHYSLPEPFSFFYKTNPTKISIQPDLSLQRTESKISVNAQDLMDTDSKGGQTINRDLVCDFIDSEYSFKGVTDTGQLFFYQNGIYRPAQGKLDRILQQIFGGDATIHFKVEIRKQIEDRNPIDRSEMNSDKSHIPVENGLLNLETYKIEPFTPDRFYTAGIPVIYNPESTASDFIKYIHEVVSEEDVALIQEWFGYCLYSEYPNPKALFLIGGGGNGKGVLTEVLTALLGTENVSALSLAEMDGHHRFSTYSLYGKLMNISAEPPTDKPLETSLFKLITGKSAVEAEQKGVQARMKFTNFAKLVVEANTLPQILDTKEALWDRIIAVEFPHSFRGRPNEIIDLGEELSSPQNLSGILVWALEGLARLRSNNFKFTFSRAQEAKKTEMQIVTNPFLAFQNQWLTFSRKVEISKQTLYDAYDLFCAVNDIPNITKGVISKSILKDTRISSKRVRENGIRLRLFIGCCLSKTVIGAYGRYRNRALRPGELELIERPEEEVEIRTCDLPEYMSQYLELDDEVQVPIRDKLIIFNNRDLVELYNRQAVEGEIKHLGPQVTESPRNIPEKVSTKPQALTLTVLSPLEEGICERCGKTGFLSFELLDETGTKSAICKLCGVEIEAEMGKEQPVEFGTTLEERRAKLKEGKGKEKEK